MSIEQIIYVIVSACCLLTIGQAIWALVDGVGFLRFVESRLAESARLRSPSGRFRYQPRATVILPCCGVDERLENTIQVLGDQDYDDYQVIFTFESSADPAFVAVGRWTQNWRRPWTRVVAGLAEKRSQKIHNLLAAVAEVSGDREVLIFLDSDAVPNRNWLGHLVAPLQHSEVGAATGFRWYSATGGAAAGIRSAWNAASVSMLHNDSTNFCWGGSTAIRRETFERLEIARHWDGALSDDYQLTRAVREAGLKIRFVPQALVSSADHTTFAGFWRFARRQYIITRVCAPEIWFSALFLCMNLINGATCAFLLFVAASLGWIGDGTIATIACATWLFILTLVAAKALVRQLAVRQILPPPAVTWRDLAWDVLGVAFVGSLHLVLLLSAALTRRFFWRHTEYEMIGPDQTRVLRRVTPAPSGSALAPVHSSRQLG